MHKTMVNSKLHLYIVYSIFIISSLFTVSAASDTLQTSRPKVGLVLSGGGALGFAHVGVLKVLQDLKVPVDCIVGTSIGALVGGTFAAGVSTEHLERTIYATDINALFDDNPPRSEITQLIKRDEYIPLFELSMGFNNFKIQLPSGASAGYKFELFLKELIGLNASILNTNFDNLPTQFRAVATNLENGDLVLFDHGELPRVLRASMSLPAIVTPAKVEKQVFIDGGLVRNLPVETALKLGCDVLIVVNLGTKPKKIEEITTSIDVAMQSIVILTEQNVKASLQKLAENDVLILPQLDEFDLTSFSNPQEIVERGVIAAQAQSEQLSKYALSDSEYEEWLNKRKSKQPAALKINKIKVETRGEVNADALMYDIKTQTGDLFDVRTLHQDITNMFGRGDFSYVGYSVVPDKDSTNIVIKAENKPWGPGYLKFGFGTASDFSSATQITLALSYRRTWINTLGAEWRTDLQIGNRSLLRTEYIQPLQIRDGAFISPYLLGKRNTVQFYDKDNRLGDYVNQQSQGGIDFGITGYFGEIRIGPYYKNIDSRPEFGIGNFILPDYTVKQSGIQFSATYDQLDRIVFPRRGVFGKADINKVQTWGDLSLDYIRTQLWLSAVKSYGKNIFSANIEWGSDLSGKDNLMIHDAFMLGGLYRLSGLYLDQLSGSQYDLASLKYYRQYADLPPQLGHGMYFGFSLEAARINDEFLEKTWERMYAASIYWGADTVLGPVYIGYGYTSTNEGSWYLVIGPRF